MQEGHSFDEYFGTFPGADGHPRRGVPAPGPDRPEPGLRRRRRLGGISRRWRSATGSRRSSRRSTAGAWTGSCPPFGTTRRRRDRPCRYYDDTELPWYWNVADQYVLFDRFFASTPGGHVADHMYWMAGTGGTTAAPGRRPGRRAGATASRPCSTASQAAGISWKVYVQGYTSRSARRRRDGPPRHQADVALAERVPLLDMPRFRQDPRLSSRIVDLSRVLRRSPAGRVPLGRLRRAVGCEQRAPSGRRRHRADLRPGTGERADAQLGLGLLGLPAELRRHRAAPTTTSHHRRPARTASTTACGCRRC